METLKKGEPKSGCFTSGVRQRTPSPFGRRLGYGFFLFLVILPASCKDDVLIPRKNFISILTDIYLSKSYFSSEGIYNARWQDTIPYNHHIVEQHGYKWAQFDSTVSWYCSRPKKYQEVYETVMANLNELDKRVSEELDPPSELWAGRKAFYLPADGRRDSVPANVLLKGVGSYVVKAKIRVYPQDESPDSRIALFLWRADTTAHGIRDTLWIEPLRKDGLMYEYRMEKTLLPGNSFTHIKGNWLQSNRNDMDTAWRKRAEIKDISVYHIPKKF
jgi:hypothetical protein